MGDDLEKEIQKDIGRGFGALEKITFVSDLLQKQTEIRNMLDMRANIVIGFNAALIVFLVGFHEKMANNLIFLFALVALGIALVLAILALRPPRMATKKGQNESLFYHHHIDSMSREDFEKEIMAALGDEEQIYRAYILETYNLTRFSNIPRKRYLYLSIKMLIYGILLAVVAYGLSFAVGWILGN